MLWTVFEAFFISEIERLINWFGIWSKGPQNNLTKFWIASLASRIPKKVTQGIGGPKWVGWGGGGGQGYEDKLKIFLGPISFIFMQFSAKIFPLLFDFAHNYW